MTIKITPQFGAADPQSEERLRDQNEFRVLIEEIQKQGWEMLPMHFTDGSVMMTNDNK